MKISLMNGEIYTIITQQYNSLQPLQQSRAEVSIIIVSNLIIELNRYLTQLIDNWPRILGVKMIWTLPFRVAGRSAIHENPLRELNCWALVNEFWTIEHVPKCNFLTAHIVWKQHCFHYRESLIVTRIPRMSRCLVSTMDLIFDKIYTA